MSGNNPNGFRLIKGNQQKFDIIGDIHGCFTELIQLVEKLGYVKKGGFYDHPEKRRLVTIGDIADKGFQNLDCLEFWIKQVMIGDGLWAYGNHCNKLYRYFCGNKVKLTHGIQNTVAEINKLNEKEKQALRSRFFSVYRKLAYYYICDDGRLVVVHGGIKKEWIGQFNSQIKTMCIYGDVTGEYDETGKPIRRDWAQHYNGKALIVYGHTVTPKAEIRNKTIDIDQGCVYGGKLTAFQYPEKKIVQVDGKKYAEFQGTRLFD